MSKISLVKGWFITKDKLQTLLDVNELSIEVLFSGAKNKLTESQGVIARLESSIAEKESNLSLAKQDLRDLQDRVQELVSILGLIE
jgi:hypothetical protein